MELIQSNQYGNAEGKRHTFLSSKNINPRLSNIPTLASSAEFSGPAVKVNIEKILHMKIRTKETTTGSEIQ
jgi:hypothetical protein